MPPRELVGKTGPYAYHARMSGGRVASIHTIEQKHTQCKTETRHMQASYHCNLPIWVKGGRGWQTFKWCHCLTEMLVCGQHPIQRVLHTHMSSQCMPSMLKPWGQPHPPSLTNFKPSLWNIMYYANCAVEKSLGTWLVEVHFSWRRSVDRNILLLLNWIKLLLDYVYSTEYWYM